MPSPSRSVTTVIPNLQAELDDVVSYLIRYKTFRKRLWVKLVLKNAVRLTLRPDRTYGFMFGGDMLSGKTRNLAKSIFASASHRDKNAEFYDVCSSDYALHALSLKLLSRFPNYDFHKLAQFHESLEANLQVTGWQVIGFIAAAVSFMLKDLPEPVVHKLGIRDYASYQVGVVFVGILIAAYLAFVFVPAWYLLLRQKRKHQFVGVVLKYTALL